MRNRTVYRLILASVQELRVMAEAEGWLMVRNKGCMPFVVHSKDVAESPEISDGFGTVASIFCTKCERPSMEIVRPDDTQCKYCG